MIRSIRITLPDDMHTHVRDGERMRSVIPFLAQQFGRAIIMPNLSPHITHVNVMEQYCDDILAAVPDHLKGFKPLMTVSLNADMTEEKLAAALAHADMYAVKMYCGNTTNASGIEDVEKFAWAFSMMEESETPLLLHGEAPSNVDVFDREKRFYETSGMWIVTNFPKLRVVCEHITTRAAVEFVKSARAGVAATVTPQHLLSNRNDMLGKGGIRPHYYCMPILKREEDRIALLEAATSGNPKFFLGTDSAPHPRHGEPKKAKLSDCGCAGCFTAPIALELYAEAFDSVAKIDRLNDFASRFGAEFYELPRNRGEVLIERVDPWTPPPFYEFGDTDVAPYRGEQPLTWKAKRIA